VLNLISDLKTQHPRLWCPNK